MKWDNFICAHLYNECAAVLIGHHVITGTCGCIYRNSVTLYLQRVGKTALPSHLRDIDLYTYLHVHISRLCPHKPG